MGNALWNVNGSISTHDLVARIKASVRQRQGLPPDPAAEPHEEEALAAAQAEVNQILLRSLDLVTDNLEYLQTQVGLVEAWVREETERSAQHHQALDEQLSQILRLVADLNTRVGILEHNAAARKATRRLNWPRFAGLVRLSRQP